MTTHVVIRITAHAQSPIPQHAAWGPVTLEEGLELLEASLHIFLDLKLDVIKGPVENTITAYRRGSPITWKMLLIELRPPTEDVCEDIK